MDAMDHLPAKMSQQRLQICEIDREELIRVLGVPKGPVQALPLSRNQLLNEVDDYIGRLDEKCKQSST